jgi:hypothetical protein
MIIIKIISGMLAGIVLVIIRTIIKQLDWFRQKYENHIKVIEETFGSDKAILKWGITSYFS